MEDLSFNKQMLDIFWRFICERQNIWYKRQVLHEPWPWTKDITLGEERFTNIYRELDPGTVYVVLEILEKDASKMDKIFNVMLYRLIGKKETHRSIGFQKVGSYSINHVEKILKHIRDNLHEHPFTGAYMVGAYTKMGAKDKCTNIARLFGKIARDMPGIWEKIQKSSSSEEVFNIFQTVYGFGPFLSFQVLVDLLYPPLLPFSHNDWAKAGPGAKRGIKLLVGNNRNDLAVMKWLKENQKHEFNRLGLSFYFLRNKKGEEVLLSLANIQNCLCEFHKYIKIENGTGRGRRKFSPSASSG